METQHRKSVYYIHSNKTNKILNGKITSHQGEQYRHFSHHHKCTLMASAIKTKINAILMWHFQSQSASLFSKHRFGDFVCSPLLQLFGVTHALPIIDFLLLTTYMYAALWRDSITLLHTFWRCKWLSKVHPYLQSKGKDWDNFSCIQVCWITHGKEEITFVWIILTHLWLLKNNVYSLSEVSRKERNCVCAADVASKSVTSFSAHIIPGSGFLS